MLFLTHWGRVTHIFVGKLTITGSDNCLAPGRHQAIIWTNAGILLFRTLGKNISEILSEIHLFLFKKMHLKMLSEKWRPFCLGLNLSKNVILLLDLWHHSDRCNSQGRTPTSINAVNDDETSAFLTCYDGHVSDQSQADVNTLSPTDGHMRKCVDVHWFK